MLKKNGDSIFFRFEKKRRAFDCLHDASACKAGRLPRVHSVGSWLALNSLFVNVFAKKVLGSISSIMEREKNPRWRVTTQQQEAFSATWIDDMLIIMFFVFREFVMMSKRESE